MIDHSSRSWSVALPISYSLHPYEEDKPLKQTSVIPLKATYVDDNAPF